MNRQERRRMGIKKKDPMISIKSSDIKAMKEDATTKGCKLAFQLMLVLPAMVIHDHYGELMKKDGDKVLLTQGPEGDEKGYTEVRMFTKSTEAFQWVLQQNYDQEDFPLDLDRMESDCLANLCELMGEPRW